MHNLRTFLLALAAGATLAACGGGGGGTPAVPAVALQPGSDVPESAAGSVTGVVAFLLSLVNSETAEPLTVGNATFATSETAEPEPIAP